MGTGGPWHYGSGEDGALHFDGAATILGMVPVANVYTMPTPSGASGRGNINATSIIIDAGVTLRMQNWNLYCTGNTQINGAITCNGGDSPGGAVGTAGAGVPVGYWGASLAGALGATNIAAATTQGSSMCFGDTGLSGSNTVGGGRPGAISLANPPPNNAGGAAIGFLLAQAVMGCFRNGGGSAPMTAFQAGCGGASGAGGGGTPASGGGGAAGLMFLGSNTISGNGTITLKGGNAGLSTGGNNGGSNGGSGGCLWVATSTINYQSLITVSVAGGTGSAGNGLGINGSNGGSGRIINFWMFPQ
jgi:hypothetical protein